MFDMNKLITVIVPVYNAEKYVKECIESILGQTYTNIQLILVDDGSTDKSDSICNQYQSMDNRVLYIHKENGGVSSARNYGLKRADGSYVIFIDADDTIGEKAIEKLVEKNCQSCMARMRLYTEKSGEYSKDEYILKIIKGEMLGRCCGILFDKNFLTDLVFDEKTGYLEDTIFVLRYLLDNHIKNICLCGKDEEEMYSYRANAEGITGHMGEVLPRLKDVEYSLNEIDMITGGKYKDLLEEKKFIIVENNFNLITDSEEIREIMDVISIRRYKGSIFKYRLFDKLYNGRKYKLMQLYYGLRKIRRLMLQGKGDKSDT